MEFYKVENQSPLYEDVQGSGIFPDSKFFTDCTPRRDPAAILSDYISEKNSPGFDLEKFVAANYTYPDNPQTGYESAGRSIEEHLQALWPLLTRSADATSGGTLIALPNPYIVPGGRFREIYYWDSYFTMLGLKVSGQTTVMQNMLDNFAALIETVGFIPNGNRSYYLGRSQPPFFAMMVDLFCNGEATQMARYRHVLELEYAFWMDGSDKTDTPAHRRVVHLPDGVVLNRYWDDFDTPRPEAWIEDSHLATESDQPHPQIWRHIRAAAESGWDFSSRWFADGQHFSTIETCSLIPVDLNCLLWFLESALQKIYESTGQTAHSEAFTQKAHHRKEAILQYCWSEESQFFCDFNWENETPNPHLTLAAVFPLFFELATAEQAESVAAIIESDFLKPGGLVTTLEHTGQQWDAPNGWAPLQWMGFMAMKRYGFDDLADQIKNNWLSLNRSVYAETGKMMEKYNVEDTSVKAGGGEYPNQDGFGWTNGVYLAMSYER